MGEEKAGWLSRVSEGWAEGGVVAAGGFPMGSRLGYSIERAAHAACGRRLLCSLQRLAFWDEAAA